MADAAARSRQEPVASGEADSGGRPDHRSGLGRRWRMPTQPLLRHGALGLVSALGLYVLTLEVSPFNDFQIAQIGIYAMAIAGLSLLTGWNGQISLGHGAFMAVGAFTTAELNIHTSIPLALELLAGAGAAGVSGLLLGVVAARLRGPYLAGVTLTFALALPAIAVKYSGVLGGEEGLTLNPLTSPGTVNAYLWLSWIVLLCALVTTVLLANLHRSHFGRAFRAVRDDEVAASLAGINVARTQVLAFVISAACAGVAGSLLGLAVGNAGPQSFEVTLSVSLLAGMVVGGTGSLFGAWVGATVLVYVPQLSSSLSSSLHLATAVKSNLALGFYGVVLIVVMIAAPGGVQGGLRALWAHGRRLPAGSGTKHDGAGRIPSATPDTPTSNRN